MLPVDYTPSMSSPVFTYPYARSRAVLGTLQANGPVHACHGVKIRFANPATGGYPLPTIAAFMQLLPAGFDGRAYRATDAAIYAVVEGHGTTRVADQALRLGTEGHLRGSVVGLGIA